jgi:hypothetical protein
MKLRLTARALADAKRMQSWWRKHRTKAPDIFERELDRVLETVVTAPMLGEPYAKEGGEVALSS